MFDREEKENLVRMLDNRPLLAENPILCRLGWHRWRMWGEPRRSPSSIYIKQGRFCDACNKYQEVKTHE